MVWYGWQPDRKRIPTGRQEGDEGQEVNGFNLEASVLHLLHVFMFDPRVTKQEQKNGAALRRPRSSLLLEM
jgi:hypothetical protein